MPLKHKKQYPTILYRLRQDFTSAFPVELYGQAKFLKIFLVEHVKFWTNGTIIFYR